MGAQQVRTRILASFRQTLLRNALMFFFGTTMLATYHYVQAAYGDIDDYYTLADTAGPFAVTEAGGNLIRGDDTASFTAGQTVGWSSSFCAVPAHPFTGESVMVRLSQDGLPEQQVSARTTHFPGDKPRCGPQTYGLRVPEGAVPGLYEIRRRLTFREGSPWPLHASFPAVAFRVVGAAAPDAAGK